MWAFHISRKEPKSAHVPYLKYINYGLNVDVYEYIGNVWDTNNGQYLIVKMWRNVDDSNDTKQTPTLMECYTINIILRK